MTEKERFRVSVRRNYDLVQTWPSWRRGAPAEEHELLHLEPDTEQTENITYEKEEKHDHRRG
jgi:hypothetical protein